MLSTLFYTWQYYDMVEKAVNPNDKRSYFVIRAICVSMTALGTIIATGFYDYYTTLEIWYILPGSGHFDSKLSLYYNDLSHKVLYVVGAFVCLCCVGSAGLLGGTIFQVYKMTLTQDKVEL
jgi:hypothetical protein